MGHLIEVWRKGKLRTLLWECKLVQPVWKTVWSFLKKLKIELSYDPAIVLQAIYPEKTITQKDTCTPVFIAALFTVARTWKQPKCPATEGWIKKMWYIYTMEYYSAIKRNGIGSFVEMWMDLETVIQRHSCISQTREIKTGFPAISEFCLLIGFTPALCLLPSDSVLVQTA